MPRNVESERAACRHIRALAGISRAVRGASHVMPRRGPSIPGYPSLTVGYPTEFQKGGIDSPPGVKMLGCQPQLWAMLDWELGS